MGNIYYGKSNTPADTQVKVVQIPSINGANGVNQLTHGDMVVVLFQYGNTHSSPKLQIGNSDTNTEVHTTNDPAIDIKTQSIEVSLNGAWVAGETKILVYTTGQNNVSYFELLGSVKGGTSSDGSTSIYGNVTVVDSGEQRASSGAAISPYGAKKLLDLTDGLALEWIQENFGERKKLMGTLSLKKGSETVNTFLLYQDDKDTQVQNTNELNNNGPKANGSPGVGSPFLTRYIPGNITFYNTGEVQGLYVGTRSGTTVTNQKKVFEVIDANNNTNIFAPSGNLTLNPMSGQQVTIGAAPNSSGNLQVNGWLKVNSSIEAAGAITGKNGLTITKGLTKLQDTTISGSLTLGRRIVKVHTVVRLVAANDGYSFDIGDSAIQMDAAGNSPAVLAVAQDGECGIDRIIVGARKFTCHFTRKLTPGTRIRINYIVFF